MVKFRIYFAAKADKISRWIECGVGENEKNQAGSHRFWTEQLEGQTLMYK